CIPAGRVDGGPHVCSFACVGLGSCTKVCKFHAISIVNGVAKVDQSLCTGCGACAAECPKGIIGLVPVEQNVAVPCRSHMKGADTMKSCDLGCIGCKKCEKTCEHGAITVTDSLASIDYEKCISCGKCFEVCPRHLITNIHGSPFVKTVSPFEGMDIPAPVVPAPAPAPAPKDAKPAVKPMPVPGPVPTEAAPVISKPVIPAEPVELPKAPASPVEPSPNYDSPVPASVVDEIISRIADKPAEAAEKVPETVPEKAAASEPKDDLDAAFASIVEEKTGESEAK
ncbi:MAG: 4Fe-4S binding protein, partial [Clostridia bacterium]|nr:4Fe-4S binding protein [Clostridia bacterium]